MAQFPSQSSASGLWSLKKQKRAEQGDNWPTLFGAPDEYFEYVTMLLPGNGTNGAQNNTFLDSSTNNFTITRNGNTTQGTFTPYGANWSNYLDGSGDWLQTASNSVFTLATGNFTVEAWVFLPQNNSSTYQGIVSSAGVSPDTGFTLSTDLGRAAIGVGNASNADLVASSSVLPLNTWVHIAGVRVGNTLTLYVNGVAQGSVTTTRSINTSEVAVGAYYLGNSPTYPLTGYVSNVRVINSALYTSNFTPSVAPLTAVAGTILLTCQSNRFIDNSTNNITINRNGDVSVQRFSPFNPTTPYAAGTIGGSGYFDGSGDVLTVSDNAAFGFGTSNFTFEFWLYYTGGNGYTCFFVNNGNSGNYIYYGLNTGTKQPFVWNDGNVLTTSTNVTNNTWQHHALVRNGSTLTIYLDGVAIGSTTWSVDLGSSRPLSIGATSAGAQPTPGYFSNFRTVKGTAVYTSNFTPPTAPLTAITNTSLLLNFTNGGIIDNAMMNDLETVGNAQISTAQSKFGGGSIAFDGTGDVLKAPNTQNVAFGTGDFTVEMWVYPNSFSTSPVLFDTRNANGNTAGIAVTFNTSGNPRVFVNGGFLITGSNAASTSTWNHLAIVKASGTITLYLNGVSVGSSASSTSLIDTAVTIGDNIALNGPYNGYLDDLRITKGYARYTANFTPPAAPFPTY